MDFITAAVLATGEETEKNSDSRVTVTLAAIGAAIGSIVLVIAVLGLAKNPALRLTALAIFAIPAVIAGFALVHGVTKHMIDSAIAINILGGIGGIVIGIAAVLNLNAVGTAALSR